MSIYTENLIDKLSQQQAFTHYDYVCIFTIFSTYKSQHTYKITYVSKSRDLFIKVLKEYDGTNEELNKFMKNNIEMLIDNYIFNFYYFDYTKHKFLLDELKTNIRLRVSSINNNDDAIEFIKKYLFSENISIYFDEFLENKFLINNLEKCIPENISDIIDFAEKIASLLDRTCSNTNHYWYTLDEYKKILEKEETSEFVMLTELYAYVVSKEKDKKYTHKFDDKLGYIYTAFLIIRDDKFSICEENIKYCLTEKHLELAFKYQNINAINLLMNNKILLNKQCLLNIFAFPSKYIVHGSSIVLEIFSSNQKITQEYFTIILQNTVPTSIPHDIEITDEIINLYASKNFALLIDYFTENNDDKNKNLVKNIITKKINECNYETSEIKKIQKFISKNKIKFKKNELLEESLEKIINKTIKKSIMSHIS